MKVVVVGAAKTGYAESITRKLISEGYSVIGTFDKEYADNAKKMQTEYSSDVLSLQQVDLSSRNELAAFVKSVNGELYGMIFSQFFLLYGRS